MKTDYYEFEGFENLVLEEGVLFGVEHGELSLRFIAEVGLTLGHPLYEVPRKGERMCFRKVEICFFKVLGEDWLEKSDKTYSDLSGEVDLGSIDAFYKEAGGYHLEGDFGHVVIFSEILPVVKYTPDV